MFCHNCCVVEATVADFTLRGVLAARGRQQKLNSHKVIIAIAVSREVKATLTRAVNQTALDCNNIWAYTRGIQHNLKFDPQFIESTVVKKI